jgi:uncharacterized Zn-binding protein involved in type VI secretion
MPGELVQVGATIQCPHSGSASITPSNQRVKVGGASVAVLSDSTSISGCSFQVPAGPSTKPQPCVTATWLMGATRVKIGGQAPLLKDSSGLCQSAEQIPQGKPNIQTTQTRVKGT